jgi:hypothetical protein
MPAVDWVPKPETTLPAKGEVEPVPLVPVPLPLPPVPMPLPDPTPELEPLLVVPPVDPVDPVEPDVVPDVV